MDVIMHTHTRAVLFIALASIDQFLALRSRESECCGTVVIGSRTVGNGDHRDGSPDEGAAVGRKLKQDVVSTLHCILQMRHNTIWCRAALG